MAIINRTTRNKPILANYYGGADFMKGIACNVNETGLTNVRLLDSNKNIVRLYHIPYSNISEVRLIREDLYGATLITCGVINPFAFWQYMVEVDAEGEGFCFLESSTTSGVFPFWLFSPFYWLSQDRRAAAEELAEAFEYMRLKAQPDIQEGRSSRGKTFGAESIAVPDNLAEQKNEKSPAVK